MGILGYQLNERGQNLRAFILIERDKFEVTTALKQLDEVKSADAVTGPYDVIATVEAEDPTALGHIVTKIKAIPGISRTVVCTSSLKGGE